MIPTVLAAFQEPGKVSFYNLVLFVHIAAAIVAFGVTFAYPFFYAFGRRAETRPHVVFWHRVQAAIGQWLITPAATVVLLAGIYLAAEGPYDFGEPFVGAGILIVVLILGVGGAYLAPRERRLGDLAAQDPSSPEYLRLVTQVERVGTFLSALALIALFLMVVKPGT